MRKLYEKKEILFAVLWIVLYCVVLGTIRGNFGDTSIAMLIALLVFAAGIITFVKANHLEEKYGLAGWPKDMKRYLFFMPMWILATGNIWDGFAPSYQGASLVIAVHSMIDVLSLFGADNELIDWIYIGVTIVVAIIYCTWPGKMKNEKPEDIG